MSALFASFLALLDRLNARTAWVDALLPDLQILVALLMCCVAGVTDRMSPSRGVTAAMRRQRRREQLAALLLVGCLVASTRSEQDSVSLMAAGVALEWLAKFTVAVLSIPILLCAVVARLAFVFLHAMVLTVGRAFGYVALLSFSFSLSGGWVVAYYEAIKSFCTWCESLRDPAVFRAQRHALRLSFLAEAAHQSFTSHQNAISRLAAVYSAHPGTLPLRRLRAAWLSLLQNEDDDRFHLYATDVSARASTGASPFRAGAVVSSQVYLRTLASLSELLTADMVRRQPPLETVLLELQAHLYRVAGILIHLFFRPFHSLDHLAEPCIFCLAPDILLSPLIMNRAFARDPAEWAPVAYSPWALSFLKPLAAFYRAFEQCIARLEVLGLSSEYAAALISAFMLEAQTRVRAIEAEQRAHDAILDAVLEWRARREQHRALER
ncbi:hypothetical protein JCM6882_007043 [Rhodosporidiobolus microsporus]